MRALLIFIVAFFLVGSNQSTAQETGEFEQDKILNKQRVIYLYNFTRYVEWKDTESLTNFTIGVLSPDSDLLVTEIQEQALTKKIKNLPVKVKHFKSIQEIKGVQILYVHQNTNLDIEKIITQISGSQILLVGEEYPFHLCMINFVDINGEFNFELNQEKINHAGLFVAPALLSFSIQSNSDWEALFEKSEKSREEDKKLVEEQITKIKEQNTKIENQKSEILKQEQKLVFQKGEVEHQKGLISRREGELNSFIASIGQQKGRLAEQLRVLNTQKNRISDQVLEISEKQSEVDKQDGILDNHKSQIDLIESQIKEKDKTLNQQSNQIDKQAYALYFSIGFGVLLFLIVFLLFRNNKNRKRANMELEVKNSAIVEQNFEIERQKDAIEKGTSTLIKSAKMASLGQVAANMAHEVNTPLGAIKTSAEQSALLMDDFMEGISMIAKKSTPETLRAFQELLMLQPSKITYRTTAEDRAIRKTLQTMLESKGINDARRRADLLLMAGIIDRSEQLDYLLAQENKEELIDSLSNLLRRRQHIFTINLAVEKASRVVNAFKSYSRSDDQKIKSDVNLENNIDTVLVIYQNLLKRGIEVNKFYDGVNIISGYSSLLTQVWTNIIHNAIQAIGEKGVLTISTKKQDENILITVEDDGIGIDPDIIDKVFDPFFTTKKGAEGTGLGLDIVNEIIKEHNGKIWVDSTLGVGTTFYVLLPLN